VQNICLMMEARSGKVVLMVEGPCIGEVPFTQCGMAGEKELKKGFLFGKRG